jgi:hypothetical protein
MLGIRPAWERWGMKYGAEWNFTRLISVPEEPI